MATVRGIPLPDCNASSGGGSFDPCCPAEVTALQAIQGQTVGLATAANQTTQITAVGTTNTLLADVKTNTTGLATAANQDTQIASLNHIDSDLHAIKLVLDALNINTDQLETLQNIANTNTSAINSNVTVLQGYVDQLESLVATLGTNTDQIESLLSAMGLNTDQLEALLTTANTALSDILTKLNAACNDNPINVNVCNQTAAAPDYTALLTSIRDNTDQLEALLATIDANQLAQTTLLTSINNNVDGVEALLTHVDGDLHLVNTALGTPADAIATAPFSSAYSEISLLKAIATNSAPLPQGVHTGATEAGNALYVSDASVGDTTNPTAIVSSGLVSDATVISLLKLIAQQSVPTVVNTGSTKLVGGASWAIPSNVQSFTVSPFYTDGSATNSVDVTTNTGSIQITHDGSWTWSVGDHTDSNLATANSVKVNGTAGAYVIWTYK